MSESSNLELNLKLDSLNLDRAINFFENYDFETIIGDTETKYFLGQKAPKRCRYCKKTDAEVTFKMDAHVMPQFMGNKNLLSYFECDSCNSLFSNYEGSFANYLGVTRTFAQIKGQTNKVPKFKDPKTGLEVFLGDTGIQITTIEGQEVFTIDEENKSFELTTERPSYIPIHIPKTIIKIGLSMLSESDVEDYDYVRRFIIQSDKDIHFKDNPLLNIYGYFIPGPPKFPKPFAQLYKRKNDTEKSCLNRQVVLYYSNYCFQMALPFANSDNSLKGKKIDQPMFPLLIDISHFEKFGKYQTLHFNFTSHEKRKGQEHKVSFSFDNVKQIL